MDGGAITSFAIKHTVKEHLRAQLARLGVNHFAIFGDMDALAATLTDAYAKTPAPTIRLSRE